MNDSVLECPAKFLAHRSPSSWPRHALCIVATISLFAYGAFARASDDQQLARQILQETDVRGGLIVHVGCDEARLTTALAAGKNFLVHGLSTHAQQVKAARQFVQGSKLSGRVTIDAWDGKRLPYVDNLVNLVVVQNAEPAMDELLRVLVPDGVAYVERDGRWTKTVKPRTDKIDEWTHYLHDSGGTCVAQDRLVGPPKHLQWVGSPTWTRHHDHMSSFSAMVSAGGRIFYIVDEGPRAEIQLPPQWMLVARDAFNGVILWKRPLVDWQTHLWPLKSGPAQLPRRLVAIGDTVYVTLGLRAPVTALDAATGSTIQTYEQTRGTDEFVVSDGMLLAVVNKHPATRPWSTRRSYAAYEQLRTEPESWAWDSTSHVVMAIRTDGGEILWRLETPVSPLTLAADNDRAYFFDGKKIAAVDRATGKRQWESQPLPVAKKIHSWFAPTLVVSDGVVVFAGGERILRHRGGQDTMTALDAATGETLWTAEHPASGYDSPEDVFVINGVVWTAPTTNRRDTGQFTGRDLRTGKVVRTFPADDGAHMPHHRCHRAKATEQFILASRTGIEYVDLNAQHWNRNDWVRGACLYGVMPANGLTYAPPQSCACYLIAKLNGLNALATKRQRGDGQELSVGNRLERGPAYAAGGALPAEPGSELATDWSTYRGNEQRSGATRAAVPATLRRTWQTDLGCRLSSPVIAEGRAFVAAIDRHTVHALDLVTGQPLWTFAAGGRVDSPPTVWRTHVYFGSADGWIYCLRAKDGELAWRFRAAPVDQRLTAFEQVESVWPVHGSVLIHEGIVHAVAGRSMFLDGGLAYVRLDAATGQLLSETRLDDRHPQTGKKLDAEIRWPNLPVALPDILSCDGQSVYMRSQAFDLEGQRREVVAPSSYKDQTGDDAHLFCPTGFLDDSWWHRTYWMYGKTPLSGAGGWYLAAYQAPTGRIMAFDDKRVYAFERQPRYFPRTTALEYHVYAAQKQPEIIGGGSRATKTKTRTRNRPAPSRPAFDWSFQVPLLGRALVKTADTLFLAGPPDLVDQEATIASLDDPQSAAQLADQAAALAGEKGGLLVALSAESGAKEAAYRLASIPVFDGLAATAERLVMTTVDGHVICLGSEGEKLEPAAEIEVLETPNLDAARRGPEIRLTSRHPDFQQLTRVAVTPCELGYRVQTPGGQVGLAVKKLPTPLTTRATFRLQLRMIPRDASKRPPGNGFLLFGGAPQDARLVKCGVRNAGQQSMIVQGPLMQGQSQGQPVASKTNTTMNMQVDVDLKRQTVTMRLLDKVVETKLASPLKAITYIGYAVHSVACEFSTIEVIGK